MSRGTTLILFSDQSFGGFASRSLTLCACKLLAPKSDFKVATARRVFSAFVGESRPDNPRLGANRRSRRRFADFCRTSFRTNRSAGLPYGTKTLKAVNGADPCATTFAETMPERRFTAPTSANYTAALFLRRFHRPPLSVRRPATTFCL